MTSYLGATAKVIDTHSSVNKEILFHSVSCLPPGIRQIAPAMKNI